MTYDDSFEAATSGTFDAAPGASTSSFNTVSVNLARASRANIAAASSRSGSTSVCADTLNITFTGTYDASKDM